MQRRVEGILGTLAGILGFLDIDGRLGLFAVLRYGLMKVASVIATFTLLSDNFIFFLLGMTLMYLALRIDWVRRRVMRALGPYLTISWCVVLVSLLLRSISV